MYIIIIVIFIVWSRVFFWRYDLFCFRFFCSLIGFFGFEGLFVDFVYFMKKFWKVVIFKWSFFSIDVFVIDFVLFLFIISFVLWKKEKNIIEIIKWNIDSCGSCYYFIVDVFFVYDVEFKNKVCISYLNLNLIIWRLLIFFYY